MKTHALNTPHNFHTHRTPNRKKLETAYVGLSPLTKKVLQHMRRAGSISARDAMSDHGITSASLARRICDLEAAGYSVCRDRRVHPITGQRYTRYTVREDA